jgi:hypothetical protein
MTGLKFNRTTVIALLGAVALAGIGSSAMAQRDPAYEAARRDGQVGEQMDGYLGIVGSATPELRRLVADLNIKRRAVYTEKAQQANPPATLEEYALTMGCLAISRTEAGEIYQAYTTKTWKQRTAGPPDRDPRCP